MTDEIMAAVTELKTRLANGERPESLTNFQTEEIHGVIYGEDDYGEYATIGWNIPILHVYAEIEDGTFGELQGFRIYL